MPDTTDDADEFSELVDGTFPRIDLVHKGANGMPLLIAKSADNEAGLIPAELVRKLAADPEPEPPAVETVTVTGSPAAVMKMIHEAALRAQSPNEKDDAPVSSDVTKADGDVEDPELAGDTPGGSTADTVPGSPAWEQKDADTALNTIAVLGRVKAVLEYLSGREATEAIAGDGDDMGDAFDLDDAAAQVDCIIRQLGGFAAGEALEGTDSDLAVDDVAKAAADLAGPLGVLEQFGPVVKAGRVLSSANEAAIRSAADSLQKVLASLPAPIADQPVAKEKENTVDEPTEAPAAVVEKAKGDPQVAVYDAKGNLVGTIDPKDLSPIASATAPEGGDADPSGDAAAAAEPVADDELDPAPAADAGTPADATPAPAAPAPAADAPAAEPAPAAPAAEDDTTVTKTTEDVLKGIIDAQVRAALQDAEAEHAKVVKALEDRLDYLEAPAPSRVVTNGAVPPAHLLRGQDHGSAPAVDVAKADDARARLAAAPTVAEREAIQKSMNEAAAAVYAAQRAQAQAARRR